MEARHKAYVEYYEARMKRYENTELYPETSQSERHMFEIIRDAPNLETFGEIIKKEHPEVACAIARVKDQERLRLQYFERMKESVRAEAPRRILETVGKLQSAQEVNQHVSKIEMEVNIQVSLDGMTDDFYADFDILEQIEIAEAIKDKLPAEWKAEQKSFIEESIAAGISSYRDHVLTQARNYDPDWEFDHNLICEERHRRRIPFPDTVVNRRMEQHKRYIGL